MLSIVSDGELIAIFMKAFLDKCGNFGLVFYQE